MQLSPHFSLAEFTSSTLATTHKVDNTPPAEVVQNIMQLCEAILEPIRLAKGPVKINSGYRSPALNKLVGGAATSQHVSGQAADIVCPSCSIEDLFMFIKNTKLPYDQVIQENTWVHVSHAPQTQRLMALRAKVVNGKTSYTPA